jgi:Golgi nucleoside diphosphatase
MYVGFIVLRDRPHRQRLIHSSLGRYGVILDAGSSGTRVYVYKWRDNAHSLAEETDADLSALPELITHKDWTKKTKPGVSTFAENPDAVGPDHLAPLLEHALQHVPNHAVKDTPFFLLATAGMRLLPETQRSRVLEEICAYTRANSGFRLPDCDLHIQVIPGETEGLYGWIAANYLLGGFDEPKEHNHGKGHHTYGFLDMGGASAQIAFAPNATETAKHGNDLNLLRLRKMNGMDEEYRIFVTTWLGFGANEARRRYVEALQQSTNQDVMELPDPCLPAGLEATLSGQPFSSDSEEAHGKKQHLLGTGKFPECLRQTFPLLEKDKPCDDEPCLLGGVHVPAIDFDVNHFVGVSEYWHTTHEVFEMGHKDKAYDFHTYQSRVNEFCSQDWHAIQEGVKARKWGKKVDESTAEEVCFKASWLINMLHDGIGIPRIGLESIQNGENVTKALVDSAKSRGFLDPFQAVNKIEDVEVSWTLGKMVLYASSQIPAADQNLPVGFGSNIPGIAVPLDFQLPGGAPTKDSPEVTEDWQDTLFLDSPRRIPGFLLFMLIICVAVFLLCGRERRKYITAKVCTAFCLGRCARRRRPGIASASASASAPSLLGKFFGLSSQTYERVDGGESGPDVEMPALYESDDSLGDAEGRTSGWATPKLVVDGPQGELLGSPPGMRPSLLGDGLLIRAESRDRLLAAAEGLEARISRSRSPGVRGGKVKENVD